MKRALLLVALTACFEDRYTCDEDADCDLGTGGRCESTGFCTSHDLDCPTARRYEEHAGSLTSTCYDDRVAPLNPCAGGQPPAQPTGCFEDVCARLPSCCELAWTDACVQVAQQSPRCEVTCDTRLAITATRGMTTELWEVTWNGTGWTTPRRETTLGPPFAWVAPAPGTSEPRLSGSMGTGILVGEQFLDGGVMREYKSVTSIGIERDNRDTIALGYDTTGGADVEIWKLDDLSSRTSSMSGNVGTALLAWGDQNRDGFPDAVSYAGGTTYSFLQNLQDADFTRKVSNQAAANTQGGATPGAPGVRSFDWLDFDGDGELDLVVFGASVRLHTNPDGLRDAAERDLDCIPPSTEKTCFDAPEPNLEASAFAGCALPELDDPSLIISAYPARKLFRARSNGTNVTSTPLAFPGDSCTCTANCTMCPGPNCSCDYNCNQCVTVLSVVSRDLDGDKRLDLIAIDARLRLYTATAQSNFTWSAPTQIPATFANTFFSLNVSVSGAPL